MYFFLFVTIIGINGQNRYFSGFFPFVPEQTPGTTKYADNLSDVSINRLGSIFKLFTQI